ncbi:MAG: NAD(P)H-dependent oxidoreductase subunit E [Candidatus Cloacimonadales bacterium]|nr:NAD(P)H-dependent oxidoreductase subunit E [Candidatus Cloacimonadales bacterium]
MMKNKEKIDQVINKFIGKKGSLIPLLQEVQAIDKYLSKDAMRYVSEKAGFNLAQIYGVATFYTMFRLKPQGKHVIRVCKGTACHVSDANSILKAVRSDLHLADGEDTTKDKLFTVVEVACLGCCSLSPVIMIDDNTFGKLTPELIAGILKKYD